MNRRLLLLAVLLLIFFIATSGCTESREETPFQFEVSNLAISSAWVEPGQPVYVSADIANTGNASGQYTVELKIDGRTEDTKTIVLDAGQTVTVSFLIGKDVAKTYSVSVGNLTKSFEVLAPGQIPSQLKVSNLILFPSQVEPARTLYICVDVQNVGEAGGTYKLDFYVDGKAEHSITDSLEGGQIKTYRVESSAPADEGTHNASVASLTGTFEVKTFKDNWERKWAQEPAPWNSKQRVSDPKDYDVQGLRVNADFKVDLSEWWDNVEEGTYWVPAVVLGTPDNTKEELLALKGKPEEAKREINCLFEALAFIHLIEPGEIHNAVTMGPDGIRWEFPKPAEPAIRDSNMNCASAANIIQYLLEDDYDEVGFVWRHSAWDAAEVVGGHCTSYIKQNGEYYFFDPGSLAEEKSWYPVEDGDGTAYMADECDRIIQSTPEKYAIFWTQVSRNDEAIFAIFTSPCGHFALGSDGYNLYYPKAFDGADLKIWKDPQDSVDLLQANYSPTPPKNQYGIEDYVEYEPYKSYTQGIEEEGQPEIATIPSDG